MADDAKYSAATTSALVQCQPNVPPAWRSETDSDEAGRAPPCAISSTVVPTHGRRLVFAALLAAAVAFAGTAVETQSKAPAAEPHTDHAAPPAAFTGRIGLYKSALGPFTRPISSRNSEAQAFFNQGFQLTYAFARPEAVRSFREAEMRDSECAICYWGEAWAWGSDLNWVDGTGRGAVRVRRDPEGRSRLHLRTPRRSSARSFRPWRLATSSASIRPGGWSRIAPTPTP